MKQNECDETKWPGSDHWMTHKEADDVIKLHGIGSFFGLIIGFLSD